MGSDGLDIELQRVQREIASLREQEIAATRDITQEFSYIAAAQKYPTAAHLKNLAIYGYDLAWQKPEKGADARGEAAVVKFVSLDESGRLSNLTFTGPELEVFHRDVENYGKTLGMNDTSINFVNAAAEEFSTFVTNQQPTTPKDSYGRQSSPKLEP
jgi:hypothetical protein